MSSRHPKMLVGIFVVTLALECAMISVASNESPQRFHHNLFEPLFGLDELDSQAVNLASISGQSSPQSQQYSNSPITSKPDVSQAKKQLRSQTKKLVQESPNFTRATGPQTTISSVVGSSISGNQQKRSTTISELSQLATSATGSNQAAQSKPEEHHWSALENYYARLKGVQVPPSPILTTSSSGVAPLANQGYRLRPLTSGTGAVSTSDGFFPVLVQPSQQQLEADDLPAAYRPILLGSHSPILANTNSGASDTKHQAFLLPFVATGSQQQDQTSNFVGFGLHQPGISRVGGGIIRGTAELSGQPIGGESILLSGRKGEQNLASFEPQRIVNVPPPQASVEGGKVKYLEWRKLPELLLIQQQQQRAKHQFETFEGSKWLDRQRAQEQLVDQAYCGPRNYVKFMVNTSPTSGVKIPSEQQAQLFGPVQLSRLQLQLAGAQMPQQIDVPVTLTAGEYPSHMGLYSGEPNDSNFLCAASWLSERYALTVASCVQQAATSGSRIVARAGEWALQKGNLSASSGGNNNLTRLMKTRDVKQVHIFPKYKNDSREHNLALVELAEPIDYLVEPFICPACQASDRSNTRASSCWTPVRSSTSSDYFDAEGEGETKTRKQVNMIELPVKLVPNDDNECYRQTRVEFFNFQHPNYICSADFRQNEWRAKLNQTEYFGSGIYCNEAGNLSLVSMLHPIHTNSTSQYGYLDLSYYRPWMRNIIYGQQKWN